MPDVNGQLTPEERMRLVQSLRNRAAVPGGAMQVPGTVPGAANLGATGAVPALPNLAALPPEVVQQILAEIQRRRMGTAAAGFPQIAPTGY